MTETPGHLLDAPVLVVEKTAKFTELDGEYAIRDGEGVTLGSARPAGQGAMKRVARLLTDGRMGQELLLRGADGEALLGLKRASRIGLARVAVTAPGGAEIGELVQETLRDLAIEADGVRLGTIRADGRAYAIEDAGGAEIARLTRATEGLAKKLFTKGDSYRLEIHRPLEEPLRSLAAASPLALDIALPREAHGQELAAGGAN